MFTALRMRYNATAGEAFCLHALLVRFLDALVGCVRPDSGLV